MARRGALTRRSSREWALRLTAALLVAILGYVVVSRSLAEAVRNQQPDLAYRLAPGDGRMAAALATVLSGPEASAADRRRADLIARGALLADPTAVAAVSTLGINAQIRENSPAARRFFAYAQRLSRRDLQTQLWSIEDAVSRGDVAEALRHHDIALRTNRLAPDILFPILASAISDPGVRSAIAGLLSKRPPWGGAFADFAAAQAPDPQAVARLFLDLRRRGVPPSREAEGGMMGRLMANGAAREAWTYYASVHPNADRRRSRDPGFTADPTLPSPFDWVLINEGGVSTSIQRSGTKSVVDFAAPTSVGGPVLRQMQLLPPGVYRLRAHSIGIEQDDDALPYWTLTCGNGAELGRVVVPNSARDGGVHTGTFRVGADCSQQTLSLVVRPSDRMAGIEGQIDQAELQPESGGSLLR